MSSSWETRGKKEFVLKLKIEFSHPLKLEENFELNLKEIVK